MEGKKHQISNLKKRRKVEVMNPYERCGRARDKDANLVDGPVRRVKRSILSKGT